jgi:hypothetical protein
MPVMALLFMGVNGNIKRSNSKEAQNGKYVRYNIPFTVNHMVFHEYWHMYRKSYG